MVKYIFSIDELFKSRVKAHPSKTKTGKLTMVREYSRKVEKANRHFSDEQIRKKVLDDRLVFAFLPRENYVINYSGMTVDDRFRYIEFMAQIKPEFKLKNYDFEYDLPKRIKKPNDIRQYFKKNNFIGDKGHKIGNVAIDLSGVTKNLNKKQVDEFIKKLPYLMIQVIGKLDGLDSGDLEKVLSVSQLEQLSDNFDLISKKDFSTRERLFSEREKLGKYSKIYEVSLAELLSGWAVSHGTDSSKIIKSISEKLFNKEHIQFYSGEKSGLKDKYKVDKDYSSRLIEHVKRLKAETESYYQKKFKDKDLKRHSLTVFRGIGDNVEVYTPASVESWTSDKKTAIRFAKMMSKIGIGSVIKTTVTYNDVLWSYKSVKNMYGWPDEKELKGKKEFVILGSSVKEVVRETDRTI